MWNEECGMRNVEGGRNYLAVDLVNSKKGRTFVPINPQAQEISNRGFIRWVGLCFRILFKSLTTK